ncbi:vacuolar membrane protein-domain-containing protein [Cercophora newfieldiana]|uniref:Vacuolar membrane protein-domain-containing protein n=1 Tax=Cercophora newfieldiana TaxID=92897 RepID=A0AA39YTG2_9PEZI|nr:vacuolar membrane protein-domain-containing protein [Cercophora newfieldiana]
MTPSTTTIAATAAAAVATATGAPGDTKPTECRLLGSFAILVQLALGALALMVLVFKRWRERPQRPVKIWFFDVSKQVFGSVLVHVANVFMSMLTSGRFTIKVMPETVAVQAARMLLRRGEEYVPNPCSFYLLNLAIDTTLGIPVLIIIVRVTTKLVAFTPLGQPPESIQSGYYGHPPNAWWWLKQSFIYFCGLMGMKICVLILFIMLPWLSRIGDWALGWTEGNEKLQIVFVMMLFPLIMNAMQYYIIDSYIKKQAVDGADSDAGTIGGGSIHGEPAYDELSVSGSEESDGEEDNDGRKHVRGGHLRLARRDTPPLPTGQKDNEYDPDVDGDSQTIIGSSNSRDSTRRGLLQKELLPRE